MGVNIIAYPSTWKKDVGMKLADVEPEL